MPSSDARTDAQGRRGIAAALAAACLFGLSTPIAKLLLDASSPLLLAGLLYTGSGFGLAALLAGRSLAGRGAHISWPRGAALWSLIGAIATGGAIAPCLLLRGLQVTDSATASLTLNLEGVFTALLAWFAFKENFDRRVLFGMGLIVTAGLILSIGRPSRPDALIGPLAIAGACLAWAIDNNLTRRVSINDAMAVACAKGLIAGPINLALALIGGAPPPSSAVALGTGLIGFAGYGLSLTLYVVALRHLGTARTGAYFSVAPFAGAAFAVLLGAPLTPGLCLAGLLMAMGVWLHLTERHRHLHRHEPIVHEHAHVHDEHHQHTHAAEWRVDEPHTHVHEHEPLEHEHAHYPDAHHRHEH